MLLNTSIKYIIISGLFFFSVAYGQFNDLKEYGLNGKVKTVEKTFYQLFEEKNGELIPTDTTLYFKKEKLYYNPSGNIDSLKRYINFGNYKLARGEGKKVYSTLTYRYDPKGNKISGTEMPDSVTTGSVTIYSFNFKSFMYLERQASGSGEVKGERVVYLNHRMRDSLLYEQFFSGGELIMDLVTYCYYNKANELYSYIEIDKLSKDTSVIHHEYRKKDVHKNPVEIYLYLNNSKQPLTIVLYRYTYYKD